MHSPASRPDPDASQLGGGGGEAAQVGEWEG